jgi:hypothetical protein
MAYTRGVGGAWAGEVMIDATIDANRAVIHVVSGSLDVTYEVRPDTLCNPRGFRTGEGYVLDIVGIDRSKFGHPYILGSVNFEYVVRRGLSKARHLERVWRATTNRKIPVSA